MINPNHRFIAFIAFIALFPRENVEKQKFLHFLVRYL